MKSKCQFLKSNYNSNINNNYYNINSIDDYIIDNIYQNNINKILKFSKWRNDLVKIFCLVT